MIKDITALVTGANRGIGRALLDELLARGARRVYATVRDAESRDRLAKIDRVVPLAMDVTDQQQIQAAVEAAGDVKLLINNAGVASFGGGMDSPFEQIRHDMETNYFGTLSVTRAFAPVIERNGGGAIVNFLTVIALASMPGLGGYSASKAASYSMTQTLRAQLADRGITVHGVFPGPVDTDMIRAVEIPKTSPRDVAIATLDGVEAGREDIFPDPMSAEAFGMWQKDPKALEKQFSAF